MGAHCPSMVLRFSVETIGAITLRWASCFGGSMAMNIGNLKSSLSSLSPMETLPSEEKTW